MVYKIKELKKKLKTVFVVEPWPLKLFKVRKLNKHIFKRIFLMQENINVISIQTQMKSRRKSLMLSGHLITKTNLKN